MSIYKANITSTFFVYFSKIFDFCSCTPAPDGSYKTV